MKFFLEKKSFKAFTLVEIIVAIAISSILFIFLFNFIVDALNEIKASKNKTEFFSNFSNFQLKMKNISEVFPKYAILIDNSSGNGSDIVLFKNRSGNRAIALGIVNIETMKFDKNYDIYGEKVLGLIELSSSQLTELGADSNKIYDYNVYLDKTFRNVFTRDLQAELYNSFKILDLQMILMSSYNDSFDGEKWEDFKKDSLFKIVLDF